MTIFVIERPASGNIKVTSFEESEEGNRRAEAMFADIARETLDVSNNEMSDAIEDGYISFGEAELYLVHNA